MVYLVDNFEWRYLTYDFFYVTFFIYAIPWIVRATKPGRSWKQHYVWSRWQSKSGSAVKTSDFFPLFWGIVSAFLILALFWFNTFNDNGTLNDLANYQVTLGAIIPQIMFPPLAGAWSVEFFKSYKGRKIHLAWTGILQCFLILTSLWGWASTAYMAANYYGDGKPIPDTDKTWPYIVVTCVAWAFITVGLISTFVVYLVGACRGPVNKPADVIQTDGGYGHHRARYDEAEMEAIITSDDDEDRSERKKSRGRSRRP
jgi:hypothetical protein